MAKSTEINDKMILIITGGHIDEEVLRSLLDKESYSSVIAVDRGLLMADRLNIQPDCIIGDFDSVPEDILSKYKSKEIPTETYPRMKDKTDTHIALEMAFTHNPSVIDLVGATGSRMDHTIANMDLLLLALNRGIHARIFDSNNKIYLMNKSFIINKNSQYGDFISLISFSFQVKGLSLHGFKYPLNGITLTAGSSLGISNELIADEGRVEFDEGILAVFESRD